MKEQVTTGVTEIPKLGVMANVQQTDHEVMVQQGMLYLGQLIQSKEVHYCTRWYASDVDRSYLSPNIKGCLGYCVFGMPHAPTMDPGKCALPLTLKSKNQQLFADNEYDEILPSGLLENPLKDLWQKAKCIADLGMGNGYIGLQMMIWFVEQRCNAIVYGYEAYENRYAVARTLMQRMQTFYYHADMKSGISLHNQAHTCGLSFDQGPKLMLLHQDGLEASAESLDLIIFNLKFRLEHKVNWAEFFSRCKIGASVVSRHHDELIFPANQWSSIPILLPTNLKEQPQTFMLFVRTQFQESPQLPQVSSSLPITVLS
jgi:hypothetical protein